MNNTTLIDGDALAEAINSIFITPTNSYHSDPLQQELSTIINGAIYNMLTEFRMQLSFAVDRCIIDGDKYIIERIKDDDE